MEEQNLPQEQVPQQSEGTESQEVAEPKRKAIQAKKGESFLKMFFGILCGLFSFSVPIFFGWFIFDIWGTGVPGAFVGAFVGARVAGKSVPHYMVSVPEVTGLLTVNTLRDGRFEVYRPGLHFRFPWEQAKTGNYINLRTITRQKEENYPTADGPKMHVKWSYQYRPDYKKLDKYLSVEEDTIEKGVSDIGSGVLSSEIGLMGALDVKKLQKGLGKKMRGIFKEIKLMEGERLEAFYGIELINVALADVDFDERFQRIRTSEQIANQLEEIAKRLKTGEISDKDALNAAMIINGDIKKNVQEVEGQGGQALAALLMAMAGAAGGGNMEGGKK